MQRKVIMAGFGGQGIMAMGQMLTYAGMIENYHVSWLPSYGPEMRGGSANCSVIISDSPIGAPNISKATDVIVMNQPSLDKFKEFVEDKGNLFINTTLARANEEYEHINTYKLAASDIANEMGNVKIANMVMLGAFIEATHIVKIDSILEAFTAVFGDKKANLIPLNKKAMERGKIELKEGKEKIGDKAASYKKTPESFSRNQSEEIKIDLNYDENIFEDDKKVLEFAIASEKEGINFYNILANKFKGQEGAEVFKSLALQEKEHIDHLKQSLDYLNGKIKKVDSLDKNIEDISWKEFQGEASVIISSFAIGMGLESDAINFYKKASEKCSDKKVRKLFKDLIYWESFHYDQLKGQYDLYKDRWWSDQSFSRM